MAGALINVPKEIKRGETFEIKTLVRHPMETGYRRGPSGEAIARDIINRFVCSFNGEEVLRAELFPAIAANPFLSFVVAVQESGTLTMTFTDDHDTLQTETASIIVA